MTTDQSIAALAALAHEHRLAAYRLLVEAGPNGLSAGLVAERLGIPPSSLTFHLQQLFRTELIPTRRLSRSFIYAANSPTMNAHLAFFPVLSSAAAFSHRTHYPTSIESGAHLCGEGPDHERGPMLPHGVY